MDSRDDKLNHSLVEALAQLDISDQGPISIIPTEMLRAILIRVQIPEVIAFRSVSSKWNLLIEDICRQKKCLVIVNYLDANIFSQLSLPFNGQIKLSKDSVLVFKLDYNPRHHAIHLSGHLCTLLAKLFPSIEQLHITESFSYSFTGFSALLQQWSPTLTTLAFHLGFCEDVDHLCGPINQLTNLKRVHLDSGEVSSNQLALTLARLEHLSGWGYESIVKKVPYLGEGISSLGFIHRAMTLEELTNWHHLNAQSVSNLVRFGIFTNNPEVLSFICKHFSSLQSLYIKVEFNVEYLKLASMIQRLARLAHLTELRIDFTSIDLLVTLGRANLRPLHNIRILSLVDFEFVNGQRHGLAYELQQIASRFCRNLSAIFPKIENLTIKSHVYPQLGNLLEAHVNLFVNLRAHDFGLI